jgi:hypothetical protein
MQFGDENGKRKKERRKSLKNYNLYNTYSFVEEKDLDCKRSTFEREG